MEIKYDDLWLCVDCLMAAVNGDGHEDPKRDKDITEGLEELGPHLAPDFDSETEEGIREFSNCGCDCCASQLAGTMHRFAVLGEYSP